jgi:hypothetical protein
VPRCHLALLTIRLTVCIRVCWLSLTVSEQQDQLAHSVVYSMYLESTHVQHSSACRKQCLSLPHGSHIAVNSIQQIVEEDVELITDPADR